PPPPPAICGACCPMLIKTCNKGHPPSIDSWTESCQQCRNEGIRQQHTHSRHQNSSHTDGTDFADGDGQKGYKSDGYSRGRNQKGLTCLARRDDRGFES